MSLSDGVLLLFRSTHDAIRAEQILISAGLRPGIVPVPKQYSPDCGVAIRITPADREKAESAMNEKDLVPTKIVQVR